MRFQPKSESEIQSMNLLQDGVYPFEVVEAHDRISKSGNDMIELKLKLWDSEGHERIIFDYLLEKMAYKLRHFAEISGLLDKYESGEINYLDCLHKTGNVEITIQKGQQKNEGGYYPDKNSVKDYVKKGNGLLISAPKKDDFLDDEIPF
jgi:hypothetical protein